MLRCAPLLLAIIAAGAAGLSLGCGTPPPASSPASAPPPAATTQSSTRQEMAALAFISYLGEQLKGSDDEVERQLAPCLTSELAKQPLTQGWTLAWGPAVYKFAVGKLDDNMMYVVRSKADPAHLAIATRGTNAKSILDWLVEDFDVDDQLAWEYGRPASGAKIAKGTSEGLHILQTMTAEGGPVPDQTLGDFLAGEAKTHPTLQIDVTGHSLGGALAPTLALWLADTQATWAPAGGARIAVYPLAGPTPGNAAFASYYASSPVGAGTDRMQNPYDVVPLAWNVETLGTMADLYEPLARADDVERGLIDGLRDLVKDKGYTQLAPGVPPLTGALDDGKPDFAEQAGWQHTCGYQCALGLVAPTFLPVTRSCQGEPEAAPPCCSPATP